MNILQTIRKPYFSIFLSSLMLLISCSQQENIHDENAILKQIVQKKVENKTLIDDFINLQKYKLNAKSSNNIEFDNDNIYEVSIDENSDSMIMANQIGFDGNNAENYAISASITENGLSNPLIVKTSKISDNIYKIEYFDSAFELISTIQLDSETEAIESFNNFQKNINFALKGCGQATADCLIDAYSNHGWVSVWAFVQTAFIPATGVALAAACAANECFIKNKSFNL